MSTGQAYELGLPWGPTMRGVRWGSGDAVAVFLHEPGEDRDLDAWGDLPARLATTLNASSLALDLPGHGLSDDPWEPDQLPAVIAALIGDNNPEHAMLIVAAAETAIAALAAAARHNLAGVSGLSLAPIAPDAALPRSPHTAKLIFAGAQSGDDLAGCRTLASSLGGWAVVTSIPTETRGTSMLATAWGPRLGEHIVAFARDVLYRRPLTTLTPQPPRRGG